MSRVYKNGLLIAVEVGNDEHLINVNFFSYSFNAENTNIENLAINTTFPLVTTQIQNESGALIGDAFAVDAYLKSLIGVDSDSTKSGFIDYNDTTGEITLLADTWTDVPNNGAGPFSNSLFPPPGVTQLIDTNTGYLDFSQLPLGAQLLVRTQFEVEPDTNNSLLEVRYLLGQGAGEYPLQFLSQRLDRGSGIPYPFTPSFPIYMGDLNTQGGVGKLQIKLSTTGKFTNAGSYIKVII